MTIKVHHGVGILKPKTEAFLKVKKSSVIERERVTEVSYAVQYRNSSESLILHQFSSQCGLCQNRISIFN